MDYKVKGLNKLSKQFHQFQLDAGFTDSNVAQRLLLTSSEITEAFEAYRKDKYANIGQFEANVSDKPDDLWKDQFEKLIKDTHEDEIADAFIRLVAYAGEHGIDLEWHSVNKMKYNAMRGYKFGGKKC